MIDGNIKVRLDQLSQKLSENILKQISDGSLSEQEKVALLSTHFAEGYSKGVQGVAASVKFVAEARDREFSPADIVLILEACIEGLKHLRNNTTVVEGKTFEFVVEDSKLIYKKCTYVKPTTVITTEELSDMCKEDLQ